MAFTREGFQRTQDTTKRLIPIDALTITGTATGSAQTLFTAGASGSTAIEAMHVRNTTGTAATLTFHAIPDGDSIGDANELLPHIQCGIACEYRTEYHRASGALIHGQHVISGEYRS